MSIEKALSDHAVALREHAEALKAYATAISAQLAAGNVGKIVADALVNASDDAARQALQDKRDAARQALQDKRDAEKPQKASEKPPVSEKPAVEPQAPAGPLDYANDVKPVMQKVIATKGSDAVREILKGLGKAKATELDADGLAKFHAELQKVLA